MEIIDVASVIAGLVILCVGGYAIVSGGVTLARKLRISSMIIGLTVVAYGTSTPELAAALLAAFNSHTELILGNIVGSNISNVGLVIGVSAVFAPLLMSRVTVTKWVPIMIGVSLLVIGMSVDGEISQTDGLILIAALIGFTIYTIKSLKKQSVTDVKAIANIEGELFLSGSGTVIENIEKKIKANTPVDKDAQKILDADTLSNEEFFKKYGQTKEEFNKERKS